MSRILLDENIPVGLGKLLSGHEVEHVAQLGWDGISNGELIAAADEARYDVFVTADQNLIYQQNLNERRVGIVILSTNNWDRVQAGCEEIRTVVDSTTLRNTVTRIDLGRFPSVPRSANR